MRADELSAELYAHLSVNRIDVPPLRTRLADLPDLTVALLDRAVARGLAPRGRPRLTPAALAVLSSLTWQGNVRELENVLEHAVVTSRDERIEAGSVRAALKSSSRPRDRR